jgi:hypothetical protein
MLEVPNKYDIIPIHTSDMASYMNCRRYWNWTSPSRNNLRRRVDVNGIYEPFWFGGGIHYALEMYYHPMLKRHPVEAWETWYKYQWEGGEVAEDWLARLEDPRPVHIADGNTYYVRGLRDILPAPDQEEFDAYHVLGTRMMDHYYKYAEANDDFDIIAPESTFSVYLGFDAIDGRENSPNYGKRLEVHARGKRDAVIQYRDTGKYGIMDHKTASVIGEDYFTKLETDPQCSNYIWACVQEGYDVDSVLYNVLRKAAPTSPTPLQSGKPSLSRSDESTTAEMFAQYILDHDLRDWFEENQKAQAYYEWLVDCGAENFIVRRTTYRTKREVANTGNNLRLVAEEMVDPNLRIYPHFSGSRGCTRCAFRAPCVAMEDGSDYNHMLGDAYEVNRDR